MQFQALLNPFDRGKAWSFKAERHIYVDKSGNRLV
jgi:hypothetical protein